MQLRFILKTVTLFIALYTLTIASPVGAEANASAKTDDVPVSEEAKRALYMHATGQRENLQPHLSGLQNLAIASLPPGKVFINISAAFRDVQNGIRFELIVNALDTNSSVNNDITVVTCRLVIMERPWLSSSRKKKREMIYRRCFGNETKTAADDSELSGTTARYESNTLFDDGQRQQLTSDEMEKLQQQIVSDEDSRVVSIGPNARSKSTIVPITTTTKMYVDDNNMAKTIETSSPTPLTNDERQWLASFFQAVENKFVYGVKEMQDNNNNVDRSIALEQQLQQHSQWGQQPHEEEAQWHENEQWQQPYQDQYQHHYHHHQHGGHHNEAYVNDRRGQLDFVRSDAEGGGVEGNNGNRLRWKRSDELLGAPLRLSTGMSMGLKDEALNQLNEYLKRSATGGEPKYKFGKVLSVTKQLVTGTLMAIEAQLIDGDDNVYLCTVTILSKAWLNNVQDKISCQGESDSSPPSQLYEFS